MRKKRFRLRLRNLLNILPKPIRQSLLRQMIHLEQSPPSSLKIKVAETKEELETAFRLLHEAYVEIGFMKPDPSGLNLTLRHALPTTTIIVAIWEGDVVGTVSIVRDGVFGLPSDEDFRIERIKKQGRVVAEVSALAVKNEFRGKSGTFLFPLLKYMYEFSVNVLSIDYFIIATDPRRADFYEGLLAFEFVENRIIKDPLANGAPMIALYLDLKQAENKLYKLYHSKEKEKNLLHYFKYHDLEESFIYPELQYFNTVVPVMSPYLLDYFFNKITNTFKIANQEQVCKLHQIYGSKRYNAILPVFDSVDLAILRRKEQRHSVSVRGQIFSKTKSRPIKITVINASQKGLLLSCKLSLIPGKKYRVQLEVGPFIISDLEIIIRWHKNNENLFGSEISIPCREWNRFLSYTNARLLHEAS